MSNSKDDLFLKDLLTLYNFLPEMNIFATPGMVPDLSAVYTCPCCNAEEEDYDFKVHEPNNFPYFSKEFRSIFHDLDGVVQKPDLIREIGEAPSRMSRQIGAIMSNHDCAYYSNSAFETYSRLITHFDKSPYFNRNLLDKSYGSLFQAPPFPAGLSLRTYYCESCYEDVFVAIRFPTLQGNEISQNQKKQIISILPHETKVYIYTMIARAVAYTYCFSLHTHYLSARECYEQMKKPYMFPSFEPLLFPNKSL